MHSPSRHVIAGLLGILPGVLLGCSKSEPPAAEGRPLTREAPAAVRHDSALRPMQVTVAGIGPLRAGMSVRDAATALHDSLTLPVGADTSACGTLAWRGGPPGVSVMFEHDRVARVDIRSGSVATDAGARIGDTESRIHSLYPGRVAVTPRKYTSGHYLTVSPAAAADSAFRIIFETDGVRVTGYRAGMLPQVAYVEGCG